MPINSQTSYWSGPILSAITLSCNIHTGRIGAISDQFALGTPWDEVRRTASQLAIQFRLAHGVKQPATLHEDELEYQEGWKERRDRLERQFEGQAAAHLSTATAEHAVEAGEPTGWPRTAGRDRLIDRGGERAPPPAPPSAAVERRVAPAAAPRRPCRACLT